MCIIQYNAHVSLYNVHVSLYRVSKKKLMPFQIQISREFHYGTLSIPIVFNYLTLLIYFLPNILLCKSFT